MMMTPTAPSEFGTNVDDLAAAYSPQELQKRYKVTKELVYLLALQKVKTDMDAAQRDLAMSQQQTPGTVKQQLENQVMQGKMQEASGIMSQMPQMAQRQPQMAAQGGIVGYQSEGGVTDEEIDEYIKENPLEEYLPRKVIAGRIAAAKSKLRTEPQVELTDYAKSRLPDIGKGAIAQQTGQRVDKLIGRPIDASGFTSTEEESSTDDGDADSQGILDIAKANALTFKDVAPEGLVDSLEAESRMTGDQIGQKRQAEIERYLKSIDATGKKQELQTGFKEESDRLEGLLDPDKLRRRRQLAFFSNIGTGGIGSILRGGGRALLEEETAQDREIKAAAKTKADRLKSLSDFDLGMVQGAEDKGLAVLQLERADRRAARQNLAGATEADIRSINAYADRIQRSEDAKVRNELTKLRLLVDNFNQLRADDRADKSIAAEGLVQIKEISMRLKQIEESKPAIAALVLKEELGTISAEDAQKLAKLRAEVSNAVEALLEKEGLQAIRDSYGQTLADIKERRANRLEQEDILGLR
tara:strand:+ start:1248 stop:2831 length:1584 start_codon:yes stop_codon:yes gene_type:complete